MNLVNAIRYYEAGLLSREEELEFYQYLIDRWLVRNVGGHVEARANELLASGECRPAPLPPKCRLPHPDSKARRKAYLKAYRLAKKAREQIKPKKFSTAKKKPCKRCSKPVHHSSYWFCYDHKFTPTNQNNDCAA